MRFIYGDTYDTVRDYFYVKYMSGICRCRTGLYRMFYADGVLIAQNSIRTHSSVEREEVFSAMS